MSFCSESHAASVMIQNDMEEILKHHDGKKKGHTIGTPSSAILQKEDKTPDVLELLIDDGTMSKPLGGKGLVFEDPILDETIIINPVTPSQKADTKPEEKK